MKSLNVCFVGVGSIAKRHIANLVEICKELDIQLNIDCFRHSVSIKSSEVDCYINNNYYDINETAASYDAVFITNPTSLHLEAFSAFQQKSNCFFIEKPLCSPEQYDLFAAETEKHKDKIIYVACPLRYTNVIQYIKNHVDFTKAYSLRCISSSYLPEWRKGVDYRKTYSARKELGGGVSIDLIHEWDYICYLLGKPKSVQSIIKKISNLEINSDDISIYIADFGDKTVELHLDYFGRSEIRTIEIFTDEDTIIGDLISNKITYLRSGKIIDLAEERDDYQKKELINFLDIIDGKIKSTNDLQKAIDVLKLTKGVIN